MFKSYSDIWWIGNNADFCVRIKFFPFDFLCYCPFATFTKNYQTLNAHPYLFIQAKCDIINVRYSHSRTPLSNVVVFYRKSRKILYSFLVEVFFAHTHEFFPIDQWGRFLLSLLLFKAYIWYEYYIHIYVCMYICLKAQLTVAIIDGIKSPSLIFPFRAFRNMANICGNGLKRISSSCIIALLHFG